MCILGGLCALTAATPKDLHASGHLVAAPEPPLNLKVWAGFLVSAFFVWLSARNVDLGGPCTWSEAYLGDLRDVRDAGEPCAHRIE